jgi:1-acyl-sn-glycerol-3-phosphate acyltransferase
LWLQSSARGVIASLGIRYRVEGPPPSGGLVVSNHLSCLDILIFSAAMPCFFVAKTEVGSWPFFGRAARTGGTIFLDRASRDSANKAAVQIIDRLATPVPVLLFPEGTSSDGSAVLRFHPRLIHPAAQAHAPITAAAIRYVPEDGLEERDLCWYGDSPFLSHLWKLLGTASISATICFSQPRLYRDARAAAEETHAAVSWMREHALRSAALARRA